MPLLARVGRSLPVGIVAFLVTVEAAAAQRPNRPATRTAAPGGSGGQAYTLRCPAGSVLTGFLSRSVQWVDRVSITCTEVKSNGTFGSALTTSDVAGGTGGEQGLDSRTNCPSGQVVVAAQVRYGSFVHRVTVTCRPWLAAKWEFDRFASGSTFAFYGGLSGPSVDGIACDVPTQPAVGIHGREGWYVDAIGFICDEP